MRSEIKRRSAWIGCSLLALGIAAAPALAAPVIDGKLTDWGVSLKDSPNVSCGDNPANCHISTFNVNLPNAVFKAEDTNDRSNNYIVGPNGGGQNYDAQFLAATIVNNKLYIAIATGQRPDNGASNFGPGDILIKRTGVSGAQTFAIEVGGGLGGGPSKPAITELDPGTTYKFNGSGATTGIHTGADPYTPPAAQNAGSIWTSTVGTAPGTPGSIGAGGSNWIYDPILGGTGCPVAEHCGYLPMQFISSAGNPTAKLGDADYIYTRDQSFQDGDAATPTSLLHSVIELAFDLPLIAQSGDMLSIGWGPICGNDYLEIKIAVPAPSGLPMFVLGLCLLAALTYAVPARRRPVPICLQVLRRKRDC